MAIDSLHNQMRRLARVSCQPAPLKPQARHSRRTIAFNDVRAAAWHVVPEWATQVHRLTHAVHPDNLVEFDP